MLEKILEFKNLSFSYVENPFIENLALDIHKGEFLMILGKNGSGKSTLLKLLFGIENKKSGEIIFKNRSIDDDIYFFRKNISLVFQNPDEQIICHTVERELAFSMENYGIPKEEMEIKIDEVLNLVKLAEKRGSKIEELSGGEKQRLCIASAMITKPDILVLDEPTSMLDSKNREVIIKLLETINRQGVTILIVSHHLKELEYCNRVICLDNGSLTFNGETHEFIKNLLVNPEKYNLSLPTSFEFAVEIHRVYGIDISLEIFSFEKAGEKIWQSL